MTFRHLRLVKRQLLAEYQVNKFARRMLEGQLYQPKPPPQHPQWVLYHSWKVGVVELDEEDAMILRSLMGGSTDIDSEARRLELVEEIADLVFVFRVETGLEQGEVESRNVHISVHAMD